MQEFMEDRGLWGARLKAYREAAGAGGDPAGFACGVPEGCDGGVEAQAWRAVPVQAGASLRDSCQAVCQGYGRFVFLRARCDDLDALSAQGLPGESLRGYA